MFVILAFPVPDPFVIDAIAQEAYATVFEEPLPPGFAHHGQCLDCWFDEDSMTVVLWSRDFCESDLRNLMDRVSPQRESGSAGEEWLRRP